MPSARDIQEMARLRAIMEGTNVPAVQQPQQAFYTGGNQPLRESHNTTHYSPSVGTSREDIDAMKNILAKLNNINGEDQISEQASPTVGRTTLTETSSAQKAKSGSFEVLISLKESNGKEIRTYNVVDSNRRDIVSNLRLQESAQAIMKLMNKGLSFDSSRVQEVIDLEEDFNRNRLETAKHKARYTRSMELNETAAAEVFKNRFNVAKANALVAQDQIKSILESLR
jgi:hypothetical protein